jgi:hypothetical protein
MSGIDQPTIGEVLRRLDDLGASFLRLGEEIRQDRLQQARTYVARETYIANRETDDQRFKALETENANQGGFRRQVLAGLVLLFFSTLAAIVLALTGLK